jgi:hypothetical protein
VTAMGVAIIDYRTVGRLRDDDGNLVSCAYADGLVVGLQCLFVTVPYRID